MTSVEELAAQLAAMQQQMANLVKPSNRLPIEDELYLVYNPHNVRVWCAKSDCPHLGRESRIEMIQQPLPEGVDPESDSEKVEVPVVRLSEPKNGAHELGIMAVFGTEREATKFVETYYKRNKHMMEEGFNLCISRVDV